PPGIFAAHAVVVVAVADPVHARGVNRIAEHVLQRPIRPAVPAHLRVSVKLAAQDAILLAAGFDAMLANAVHGLALALGFLGATFRAAREFRQIRDALGLRQAYHAGIYLVVHGFRACIAPVGIMNP